MFDLGWSLTPVAAVGHTILSRTLLLVGTKVVADAIAVGIGEARGLAVLACLAIAVGLFLILALHVGAKVITHTITIRVYKT